MIFLMIISLTQIDQTDFWEIHFQDGFQGDYVSIWIGDTKVFTDVKLKSDEILGLAPILLKVDPVKMKCFVIEEGKTKSITLAGTLDMNIQLTFSIGSKKLKQNYSASNGLFIGLFRNTNGNISSQQSKVAFLYD